MSDTDSRPLIDPVTRAAQTGIGTKLRAASGVDGLGMHRKELKKLVRMKDGVAMMSQAPRTSSETIAPLENMLRMAPTTRRQRPPRLSTGDRMPDFSLVGSHGDTTSLRALRGKRPFAMRLTRAMGTTTICPACVPGLDELVTTYTQFEELGAELIVVFPVTHEQTTVLVDTLELPYPLYANEEMTLFKEFETGYSGGVPLPAWIIADRDGVIQFLWRAAGGGLFDHYPEGAEIVDVLRQMQRA